jgi:DnaD/phage-associated family protein
MAQRRMFSRKITESDQFLDMPISAQVLYFHINMQADDDGFVGNVKTIKRMIGASDDDLKLLIAKQFLIPFETGIVVIRDWKIHNYIQKDRYTETFYKHEKAMLETLENKQYQLTDTECIQNVSISDTQDRLGKDRLDKGREGTTTGEKQSYDGSGCNVHLFYQQNFGIEQPTIQEDIEYWIEDLSAPVVVEALKKAIESEKPYSYAKGIMRKWANKGIRTIEQVEQDSIAWDRKQSGVNSLGNGPDVYGQTFTKENDYELTEEDKANIADVQGKLI